MSDESKAKRSLTEAHRDRIQVTVLLDLLHQHAVGQKKLTMTRLKAIELLLKKKLPDLGIETNRGEVAPVTFIFGQSPANAAPAPGASPAPAGEAAPAANPFVIAPSKPPEADTTKH